MTSEQAYAVLLAAVEAEVAFRHRSFVMSKDLKEQLRHMASWLTSDSTKFGILLCGKCGNGKSTMLKAFQQLLCCLQIPKADGIPWGLRLTDAQTIADWRKTDYVSFRKLVQADMLGIDDLGVEPKEVLDYGNVMTPVIDLITRRYENQLFTFITTNLTPSQIRDRYGERIADRLNEMVEKIVFTNPTYRLTESEANV